MKVGVFYCVDAGFSGACHHQAPITPGACNNLNGNLAVFNDDISSVGPDDGLICNFFV
jgi:hypothetical protein